MIKTLVAAAAILEAIFFSGQSPAWGQASVEKAAPPACETLENIDFSGVVDATTHVTSSKLVGATADIPEHCRVLGYIAPSVGIELWLPTSAWNGKLIQVGCGGFCGVLLSSYYEHACDDPLKRGYACVASDMGHQSTVDDGLWADNNLQAKIDWSYRATHVAALASKAITTRYFRRLPARSYFMGCSTGGRQGMVEAQRFPWDYDGIIAGAPAIDSMGDHLNQLWAIDASKDGKGEPILSALDITILHDAVIDKCDMDDGVRDGVIGDPRACKFNPSDLLCRGPKTTRCLSEPQIAAINKIYSGPTDSNGRKIYMGSPVAGSELNWIGSYLTPDQGRTPATSYLTQFFQHMSFMPDAGPRWTLNEVDFDRDYKRFGMLDSLLSATNPDLRKFKNAGGKLIVYQGWQDESEMPGTIADYYETAERTMGGREATQKFFRLFMVPGMNHCAGGPGAYAIDYLTFLEAWVEHGTPPDVVTGGHPKAEAAQLSLFEKFPLDSASVAFSRPVYPYPVVAKYRGSGDPTDAANFGPAKPD